MLGGMTNGTGMINNSITQTNLKTGLMTANGEKDAVRLIKRFGCESETVKRVFANVAGFAMGRAPVVTAQEESRVKEERQKEIRETEEKRQLGYRTSATKSCITQFKKKSFCDCLIKDLDEIKITDSEWGSLRDSFKEIIPLGKKYNGLRDSLKACRTNG